MDFRWVAAIALWTMLSGPVFIHLAVSSPGHKAAPRSLVRVPIRP